MLSRLGKKSSGRTGWTGDDGDSTDVRAEVTRSVVTIDEDLLERAQKLLGYPDKSAVVRESLRLLIERESAQRLARLGGSEPALEPVTRQRDSRLFDDL